jgi:methionyl-tRNA formyltransferase
VVVAYGLLLPKAVLDIPRLGCLNVHASLLPRWRGAAPIQRAIEAGDAVTGVTIMLMEEGLDTGPMLARIETPIDPDDTAATLHDRLAALGAPLLVETLAQLAAGQITPTPQPAEGVAYAKKIEKAEARIDWTRPAVEVARQIQAFSPFPGAWFMAKGERIKALSSHAVAGAGKPGEVIAEPLVVACGSGAVSLTRLQRPGKNVQDIDTFLRGFALPPGTMLE